LIDCRGLVEQLINRVETRVGSLSACAYAGRHILKVLFDTCLWGLAIRVGMPQRTADAGLVEDISAEEGVVPDPSSIHGSDELLRRRTVLFVEGVTWRRPITRSSDRLHECAFASGPVW